MKPNLLFTALAVAGLLAGCKQVKIDGDGQLLTRQFAAGEFREIQVYGYDLAFDYVQEPDSAPALEVTLDENLFDRMLIEAAGNTLLIRPKNRSHLLKPTRFHVRARSRSLVGLKKAGSGDFRVISPLKTDELNISTAGGGFVILGDTANVGKLEISLAGSDFFQAWRLDCGELTAKSAGENVFFLRGRVDNASFKSTGQCTVKGPLCEFTSLACQSAGKLEIEVRVSEMLKIKSAGHVKVQYWGNPDIHKKIAGDSLIDHMGD